jgi:hypothetical protein
MKHFRKSYSQKFNFRVMFFILLWAERVRKSDFVERIICISAAEIMMRQALSRGRADRSLATPSPLNHHLRSSQVLERKVIIKRVEL